MAKYTPNSPGYVFLLENRARVKIVQDFDNFVIPAGQTVNSGRVLHVVLTKGLLGSLPLTTSSTLDVRIAQTGRYVSISSRQSISDPRIASV